MDATLSMLLAGPALLASGGLLLALRGRRVRLDDHALCKACGFDLTGYVNVSRLASRPSTCPKCSRPLASARDVRIGHRRAARGVRTIAVVALGAGAGLLALGALWTVGPASWDRAKPVALLMLEVDKARAPKAALALHELVRREGRLSRDTLSRLAERAMAPRERSQEAMQRDWWKVIEAARRRDAIDDARAGAFVATWFRIELSAREVVREDRPLWIATSVAPIGAMLPDAAASVARVTLRDREDPRNPREATTNAEARRVEARFRSVDRVAHALRTGEHTVVLGVDVELRDASRPDSRPTLISASREVRLRVVPLDQPVVPMQSVTGGGELVAENLSLRLTALRSESGEISLRTMLGLSSSASILPKALGTNLAYDVIAHPTSPVPGGSLASWPLGRIVLHLVGRDATRQLGEPAEAFVLASPSAVTLPADFDLATLDLELRPSPPAAEPFPQLANILGDGAWYRNVPVRWAE